MILAVHLICALTGGLYGWVLPSLVCRLAWRSALFEEPAGEQRQGETAPRPHANTASVPVWHRVGLAASAGISFSAAAAVFGATWQLPVALGILAWLALVAAVDLETRFIPNRLTYPAILMAPPFILLWPGADAPASAVGALAGGGFFGLAYLLNRQGLGLGDVKLALVLGLYLGWRGTLVAVAAAVCLGGLAAVVALLCGRSRKSAIPYGPMLAAGGAIGLLAGGPLWRAYLGLTGLP